MDEIAKLLEQANSPSERATLLVLFQIQQNLTRLNTAFDEHRNEFATHRDEFQQHVTQEQGLLNKGLGAWMALTLLLTAALTIAGWYVGHHILDVNAAQQSAIDRNSNRLTALEALTQQFLNGGK